MVEILITSALAGVVIMLVSITRRGHITGKQVKIKINIVSIEWMILLLYTVLGIKQA